MIEKALNLTIQGIIVIVVVIASVDVVPVVDSAAGEAEEVNC